MERIALNLTEDEAVVLFDWLARFNESAGDGLDDAEQRILFDLEAQLESILPQPFMEDYNSIVARSRDRINRRVE